MRIKYIRVFFLLLSLVGILFTSEILAQTPHSGNHDSKKSAKKNLTISEKHGQENKSPSDHEVTLVVHGEGKNQTEAETNALRSAIEQTFGTFVSANTTILNDELIKDEIATVSSGNIKSYTVLSTQRTSDDLTSVSLEATVSIGHLINYVQSHGSSVELAGQTFLQTIKLRELNAKNEYTAILHLKDQIAEMAPTAFDFDITIGDPIKWDSERYNIPIVVRARKNENFAKILQVISKTMSSLAVSSSEASAWKSNGMRTYEYYFCYTADGLSSRDYNPYTSPKMFSLRNNINSILEEMVTILDHACQSFILSIIADKEYKYKLMFDTPIIYDSQGERIWDDTLVAIGDNSILTYSRDCRYKKCKTTFRRSLECNTGSDPSRKYTSWKPYRTNETIQEFEIKLVLSEKELSMIKEIKVIPDNSIWPKKLPKQGPPHKMSPEALKAYQKVHEF